MKALTKAQRVFPRWAFGRVLLLILTVVILVQLVLFAVYSQQNHSAELKVNHDMVARQVIHLIQTVGNAPLDVQQSIVTEFNIPNFNVSINDKPKWPQQFINKSLWHILSQISEQEPDMRLSVYLGSERWLNIFAVVAPPSARVPAILLLIEGILTVMILFSLWTISRYTAPLKNFTEAAERLGVDLRADPLPIDGPAAVRAMAHAMNKMQARIVDLLAARTQMLAAISHDLRTPLTRLKLRTQYIDDENQQKKFIGDLDQMEAMLAETLIFAREDGSKGQWGLLDLASLIDSICQDFASVQHEVQYLGTYDRTVFYGGVVGLRRVFNNLIENALKYAGNAVVQLKIIEEKYIISIRDHGPGIPAEQLAKVFLPFYRGDQSRSRQTGGTGLGLTVARDIIQAHGGTIDLRSPEEGGLEVIVIFTSSRA